MNRVRSKVRQVDLESDNYGICSVHFQREEYVNPDSSKKRLKIGALPFHGRANLPLPPSSAIPASTSSEFTVLQKSWSQVVQQPQDDSKPPEEFETKEAKKSLDPSPIGHQGIFPLMAEGDGNSTEYKMLSDFLINLNPSSLPRTCEPAVSSDSASTNNGVSEPLTKKSTKKAKKPWSLNGYRCLYCPRIFNYSSERSHHEMVHTRPHKCTICSKGWPSNFALRLHMQRIHHNQKPTRNIANSDQLNGADMPNPGQVLSPIDKIYTCSECPFISKDNSAIYRHKKHHATQLAHKCQYCSCSYSRTSGLTRHINHAHPQFRPKPTPKHKNRTTVTNEDELLTCVVCFQSIQAVRMTAHRKLYHPEVKPYACTECSYSTGNPSSMWFHRKSHVTANKFNCLYCSASYSTLLRVNFHIRKEHPKCATLASQGNVQEIVNSNMGSTRGQAQFSCCLCSKIYNWESDLRLHMGIHIMGFTCSICSRRYPHKYALGAHMKRGHAGTRFGRNQVAKKMKRLQMKNRKKPQGLKAVEMSCPACDVKLVGKTQLGLHLKLYHPKFEAYQCTECPFKTASRHVFYPHTLIHQRDEIFKCNYCSASFEILRTREQHIQSVHPGMASDLPEPEQALAPRKASVRPTGYYKAIETVDLGRDSGLTLAQEVICRICGDLSSTRSGFELHFSKCHENDKPYVCGECPFKCVNYSTLTGHEKLHSEKNAYKCDYCSASFVTAIRRTIHLKSVHKGGARAVTPPPRRTSQNFSVQTSITTANSIELKNCDQVSEPQIQYECGECHRAFLFSVALKVHQRTFHPSVGCGGQD